MCNILQAIYRRYPMPKRNKMAGRETNQPLGLSVPRWYHPAMDPSQQGQCKMTTLTVKRLLVTLPKKLGNHAGDKEKTTMKHFFTHALAASLMFAAGMLALPSRQLAGADDTTTFRQADRSLTDALSKGDAKAVSALLDDRFQWVEAN